MPNTTEEKTSPDLRPKFALAGYGVKHQVEFLYDTPQEGVGQYGPWFR